VLPDAAEALGAVERPRGSVLLLDLEQGEIRALDSGEGEQGAHDGTAQPLQAMLRVHGDLVEHGDRAAAVRDKRGPPDGQRRLSLLAERDIERGGAGHEVAQRLAGPVLGARGEAPGGLEPRPGWRAD